MDSYRKVPADLLAAIAGYSFKTYIPPPPPVGFILNLFNGLTEPSTKDGIWFKTEDELGDGVIQMWLSQNNLTWTTGNAMPNGDYGFAGASVGTKVYMCGGDTNGTVTRILGTDDTVDYQDGTVMMAVGTLTHINTANVVKLAEGITLNISGVWIVQDGYMINYETYYGNGVSWVKKKDAD